MFQLNLSLLCLNGKNSVLYGILGQTTASAVEALFPLGYGSGFSVFCNNVNHSSAIDYLDNVEAYFKEEMNFGAFLPFFQKTSIKGPDSLPFMTREKPQAVIIDLPSPNLLILVLIKTHI